MIELVDTHCHIDVAEFAGDYRDVLRCAAAAGVRDVVVPAVDRAGWPRLLELCAVEPGCHPALGLHPLYLDRHRSEDLEALSSAVANHAVVALGEIGMDLWEQPDAGEIHRQEELFVRQVRIAAGAGLPVLLHARKAHDQVLSVIRRLGFSGGGIVHAFSGSLQQAQRYIEHGFALGIGGTITYDRARRLRGVAASVPLSALVLETDAPDIPPASHRRQRNSPAYLPEILASLAMVRNEPETRIGAVTTATARRLLRLC